MSFQANEPQKSWFAPNREKSIQQQAKRIAAITDDGTSADEILKISGVILVCLLAYSGLLGAMSYYKNFEPSFGHQAALFMSLVLALSIEVGKSFFGKWALRIPFFRGLRHIVSTPHNTFLWLAALLFCVAAFVMSVHNSTKGGEQLARMLRHEREKAPFQANTNLDAQIEATQKSITDQSGVKYKGVQTYHAQKSTASLSTTLSKLTDQRNKEVERQRKDWEAEQATKADNQSFAAALVMASGGWVEALQMLLLLLLVSCERTLLARAQRHQPTPQPTPQPQQRPIGFQSQPVVANNPPQNPIGFKHYGETAKTPPVSHPTQLGVSQSDTGVTHDIPNWAAFRHYMTAFQRDAANLKNENGLPETVCKRIGNACKGMTFNLSAIGTENAKTVFNMLQEFHDNIHAPFLAKYPEERRDQTPVVGYWDEFSHLYETIAINIQRANQ